MSKINDLISFLDASVSVYHAAENLAKTLENSGYQRLWEKDSWSLTPGGKYFLVRGGTAVIAFRIPKGAPKGFLRRI